VAPAVLISLPHGLTVSGVTTWAARLAGELVDRGWRVGVAKHATPPGSREIEFDLDGADVFDLTHLPPFAQLDPDIEPFAPIYRDALDELGWSAKEPAILLPNLEAGSYALAAALATTNADRLRVVGWQHSDTRFDDTLMRTYEPMLGRIVGVSDHIAKRLAGAMPWRRDDIIHLPYGVEVRDEVPGSAEDEPIRIIYTGRIEHEQKRVGVLCELAHELERRSVPHRFDLFGDGPAATEVDQRLSDLPRARRLQPQLPDAIRDHLDDADVFVLASRYEGFSISMLEAMSRGAVPIVTRVDSGACEAIEHGRSGLHIDASPDEPEEEIAARFADQIERLSTDRTALCSLRRSALERAKAYSIDAHARRAVELFEQVVSEPPRFWPLSRPCAFADSSRAGAVSGTVPPDAEARTRQTLETIPPGAVVAIYGAGRFARAVAGVLADAQGSVACITDDNPALWGGRLWGWPIVDPRALADRGVTDILIASWVHADAMASRIRTLLPSDVRIHPLYTSTPISWDGVDIREHKHGIGAVCTARAV